MLPGYSSHKFGPLMMGMNQLIGKKVLLIDDDDDLLKLSSYVFKRAGAQVITAHDGLEGISKLLIHQPNLIMLDIMMPGVDGFEVCQKIRQISNVPLIILTALDPEQNIVQAVELGADDFLEKPFTAHVLLAHAKALLRRSRYANELASVFKYDDGRLTIDTERHQILLNGQQVKSGPTEFRLLAYLERNAGRTLTYEQLLANVWGEEYRGNVDVVHVYISNLRGKIEENPRDPHYIQSIHGVGYIFERQYSTRGS